MPKRLGEILVEAGLIDANQLGLALREQTRWGGQLGRILLDMNLVEESTLVRALSRQLGVPAVDLRSIEIAEEDIDLVEDDFAVENEVIPIRRMEHELHVAMSNPTSYGVLEELSIRTELEVHPYVAGPKAMEEALARHYGRGAGAIDLTLGSAGSGGHNLHPEAPSGASGTIMPDQASGSSSGVHATASERRKKRASRPPGGAGAGPASAAGQSIEQLRREVASLQQRVGRLESLLDRDEEVIRKLLGLIVDKGVASREEILRRIK